MDMAAFSFDGTVAADIPITQAWACDIWEEAQSFMRNNHRPDLVHQKVEERPMPRCAVSIYIAGPPCQPWARGGRALGEEDPRAILFDHSIQLIATNWPLAFILEEK